VGRKKEPREREPTAEFQPRTLRWLNGPVVERSLAERGACLHNGLWGKVLRALKLIWPRSERRDPLGSQLLQLLE
jgi:hypothetical protein